MQPCDMNVIVVDDDEQVAELYTDILKSIGIIAHTFTDPHKALGYLSTAENRLDLVISDFNMPGLNGHDLIRIIRHNSSNKHTRFIMISGYEIDKSNLDGIVFMKKPLARIRDFREHIKSISEEMKCF